MHICKSFVCWAEKVETMSYRKANWSEPSLNFVGRITNGDQVIIKRVVCTNFSIGQILIELVIESGGPDRFVRHNVETVCDAVIVSPKSRCIQHLAHLPGKIESFRIHKADKNSDRNSRDILGHIYEYFFLL